MEVKATAYTASANVRVSGVSEDDALQRLIAALEAEIRRTHDRLRANQRAREAIAP